MRANEPNILSYVIKQIVHDQIPFDTKEKSLILTLRLTLKKSCICVTRIVDIRLVPHFYKSI